MQISQYPCSVCLCQYDQLYSIMKCRHFYCLQCCRRHLEASIDRFQKIQCLSTQCTNLQIDERCEPFRQLSAEYAHKYRKLKRMEFLHKNPHIKCCKVQDCEGQLITVLNSTRCTFCRAEHCGSCLEIKHEGQCSQQQKDMMQALNYKKCCRCHVYVEKAEGCNYVTCKCGCHFCYTCGVQWLYDPCRLRVFIEKNQEIRKQLSQIRLKTEFNGPSGFVVRIFTTAIQLLLMPLWIFVGALLVPTILVSLFLILYILLCPLVPVMLFGTSGLSKTKRTIGIVFCILLYPLISALLLLVLVIFAICFPCIKDKYEYHHGLNDPLIQCFLRYTVWFLKNFNWIASL